MKVKGIGLLGHSSLGSTARAWILAGMVTGFGGIRDTDLRPKVRA